MVLCRLAKADGSVTSGGCPALYIDDDPRRMICQGKVSDPGAASRHPGRLIEVHIPAETVFRSLAKRATEDGDDDLTGGIEAFLDAHPEMFGAGQPQMTFRGPVLEAGEMSQLLELLDDESAIVVTVEIVLRETARMATRYDGAALASLIEVFMAARGIQ